MVTLTSTCEAFPEVWVWEHAWAIPKIERVPNTTSWVDSSNIFKHHVALASKLSSSGISAQGFNLCPLSSSFLSRQPVMKLRLLDLDLAPALWGLWKALPFLKNTRNLRRGVSNGRTCSRKHEMGYIEKGWKRNSNIGTIGTIGTIGPWGTLCGHKRILRPLPPSTRGAPRPHKDSARHPWRGPRHRRHWLGSKCNGRPHPWPCSVHLDAFR